MCKAKARKWSQVLVPRELHYSQSWQVQIWGFLPPFMHPADAKITIEWCSWVGVTYFSCRSRNTVNKARDEGMVWLMENWVSFRFLCRIHRRVTFHGWPLMVFHIFWITNIHPFLINIDETNVKKNCAANTKNFCACEKEK